MSSPRCTHLDTIHKVEPSANGLPIVASREPGEHWKFCYIDDVAWE